MASLDFINALHAMGYTNAAIGRAIGRDSSYIAQVAKGKKPGTTIQSSLESLIKGNVPPPPPRGATIAPAPRKTTKTGAVARVRQRATEINGGRVLDAGRGAKTIQRELARAARAGKQVNFTVRVAKVKKYKEAIEVPHAEVELFSHGGYNAQAILDRIAGNGGDVLGTILDYVNHASGIESASGIEDVVIRSFTTGGKQ